MSLKLNFKRVRALMLTAAACAGWPALVAAESATGSVAVTAQFSSWTSLKVSTDLLIFDVEDQTGTATAALEFSAGARTQSGAEVTLSVETRRPVEWPGTSEAGDPVVILTGAGPGTAAGPVGQGSSTVASRWIGSGLRTGRLVFTLKADARGRYAVPVHFMLSAP